MKFTENKTSLLDLLRSILLYPYRFLADYLDVCYHYFDPVIDVPSSVEMHNLDTFRTARERHYQGKHHYFIHGIGAMAYFAVDSLWFLRENGWVYDNKGHPIDDMFVHKMFPELFWDHGDKIMGSVTYCGLVVFYCLWRRPWLEDRYTMYLFTNHKSDDAHPDKYTLIVDGKVWNSENTQDIARFRAKNRQTMRISMTISTIFLIAYFQYNFHGKPKSRFAVFKYYFEFCFFLANFLFHAVYCEVILFFHFFTATRFTILKQKHLIKLMNELIEKLERPQERAKLSFHLVWMQFLKINEKLAYQCNEIAAYNRFWSIHLTMQFTSDIVLVVYMTYCVIFVDAPPDQMAYFLFFMVEIGSLIFAVIYRCSIVDSNNDICYLRNMKICTLLQIHYSASPRQMANIYTIATNKNFSRCCFRLSNGYRLDSTAFNMVVYIISTFFLMTCRRNNRKLLPHKRRVMVKLSDFSDLFDEHY